MVGMSDYGFFLEHGLGCAADPSAAAGWYRRAAELGDATAANNLGVQLLEGRGVAPDPADAAELLTMASHAGSPAAVNNLGICYEDGLGLSPSLEVAEACYRAAAEQGHVPGMLNYARMLAGGARAAEALPWLERALAGTQGSNADVCYALGNVLEHLSSGQTMDFVRVRAAPTRQAGREAAALLRRGQAQHAKPGPDPRSIRQLYQRAADAGHVGAMFRLACDLWSREEDRERAVPLFLAAAGQGHADAVLAVAALVESSRLGMQQDPRDAYDLVGCAAALGSTDARSQLESILS